MDEELTPYERAGWITYLITTIGLAMTTREVAAETQLTRDGALKMLKTLSHKIPIYDDHGVWRRCP